MSPQKTKCWFGVKLSFLMKERENLFSIANKKKLSKLLPQRRTYPQTTIRTSLGAHTYKHKKARTSSQVTHIFFKQFSSGLSQTYCVCVCIIYIYKSIRNKSHNSHQAIVTTLSIYKSIRNKSHNAHQAIIGTSPAIYHG